MDRTPPDMKVRLSFDLRRKIADAAKLNNRTLNSEIIYRLEASFQEQPALRETDRLTAIENRLSEIEALLEMVKPTLTESPSKVLLAKARSSDRQ